MYYDLTTSIPTKITSIETYKMRIEEIVKGQLKNLFDLTILKSLFFWIFAILLIPLRAHYFIFCILEIVINTILLPLYLIPGIRKIAFFISIIIWALGVAVGRFSGVDLTYNIEYKTIKNNNCQTVAYKD
ncbi:MAG: hypothetical protein E7345_01305 [Clostridiales bacterium]|nr:hypothetical protein [Clostridiales bacterium]